MARIDRCLVLAGLIAAPVLVACQDQAAAPAPQTLPAVTVATVERRDVQPSADFIGRVAAVDTVELRAKVGGTLTTIAFEDGAMVSAGQLLFEIDDEVYRAAAALAEASAARARVTLDEANLTLERTETLAERGTVSPADLDAARADANRAAIDLVAEEAGLLTTRIDLGDTRILAPMDGRIGAATTSVGNLVGPSTGVLATITTVDPVHVGFPVSERDLVDALEAAAAQGGPPDLSAIEPVLTLPNGSAYAPVGQIDFVGTAVDATTGTIPMRATFPNPDRLLVPGQFVTVTLRLGDPTPVLTIPQAAIQEDQTGKFVLTVDEDDTVAVTPITVGAQEGTDWIVTGGLDEGDTIIVQGLQKVRPGMVVDPTPAAAPAVGG